MVWEIRRKESRNKEEKTFLTIRMESFLLKKKQPNKNKLDTRKNVLFFSLERSVYIHCVLSTLVPLAMLAMGKISGVWGKIAPLDVLACQTGFPVRRFLQVEETPSLKCRWVPQGR
jgi:fructose-1,6-bisphosphatase/inositol monophosphatase family enzyme